MPPSSSTTNSPEPAFNIVSRSLPDGLTCMAVVCHGEVCICVDPDKPHSAEDAQRLMLDDAMQILAAVHKQRTGS